MSRSAKAPRGGHIVQDNAREYAQAARHGLIPTGERIGIDAYDALGNPYELKTTSKGGVSTARDLGPSHLAKWRRRYWIISSGYNTPEGFEFEEDYFLAPEHLETWFRKIEVGFEAAALFRDRVIAAAGDNLSDEDRTRLTRLIHDGMLLNDPNIPMRYVRQNGIPLQRDAYGAAVLELTRLFPLDSSNRPIAA